MMWLAVTLLFLIAIIAAFVLGVLLGVALELYAIKRDAPDIFYMYQDRMRQKEEWKDGAGQGSV